MYGPRHRRQGQPCLNGDALNAHRAKSIKAFEGNACCLGCLKGDVAQCEKLFLCEVGLNGDQKRGQLASRDGNQTHTIVSKGGGVIVGFLKLGTKVDRSHKIGLQWLHCNCGDCIHVIHRLKLFVCY